MRYWIIRIRLCYKVFSNELTYVHRLLIVRYRIVFN